MLKLATAILLALSIPACLDASSSPPRGPDAGVQLEPPPVELPPRSDAPLPACIVTGAPAPAWPPCTCGDQVCETSSEVETCVTSGVCR